MIKYLFTDTEGSEALVDIKTLEDRYYWSEYDNYPTFAQWMAAHEKDGSVEELDVISDEEVEEIKKTAKELKEVAEKLYDLLGAVDGHSIDRNIKEYGVLLMTDNLYDSIEKNACKLERDWQ